ncbi:MAG TPA: TIGR03619 family F420-dependent LLM class oxidoreductase [Acidimicrobiia bacterium]|nr:TIGR03619 family F420-dependent LLM class oxidoreductase [Acidimicrobiia bacterium]
MKFATGLPGVMRYPPVAREWEATMSAADFQLVARTVDELGFDSIAIPEHIVMPVEMVESMGSFWSHAFTAMAFVAGATTRLIVDSSVIVLPYHHPVVLAKAVSTLDRLTGGRVRLSVGVGHAEREFAALRVPFHERGRITDEYLAAMIELWTNETPEFHGRFVEFEQIAFEPKPVQEPHPAVWIGGNSRAAMRRAARHDGWYPWLITAEQLPGCLRYLRALPEFETRTRPFDVSMPVTILAVDGEHRPLDDAGGRGATPTGKQLMVDAIGHLQDIGVTWTSVPAPPAESLAEHLDGLHWIAEEVLPAFR